MTHGLFKNTFSVLEAKTANTSICTQCKINPLSNSWYIWTTCYFFAPGTTTPLSRNFFEKKLFKVVPKNVSPFYSASAKMFASFTFLSEWNRVANSVLNHWCLQNVFVSKLCLADMNFMQDYFYINLPLHVCIIYSNKPRFQIVTFFDEMILYSYFTWRHCHYEENKLGR